MVDIRQERVLALPDELAPDTIYYVKPIGAERGSIVVTGSDGAPIPVGMDEATMTELVAEANGAAEDAIAATAALLGGNLQVQLLAGILIPSGATLLLADPANNLLVGDML